MIYTPLHRIQHYSTHLYGFRAALIADTLADDPSAKDMVTLNKSFHFAPTRRASLSRWRSIIGSSSLYRERREKLQCNIQEDKAIVLQCSSGRRELCTLCSKIRVKKTVIRSTKCRELPFSQKNTAVTSSDSSKENRSNKAVAVACRTDRSTSRQRNIKTSWYEKKYSHHNTGIYMGTHNTHDQQETRIKKLRKKSSSGWIKFMVDLC